MRRSPASTTWPSQGESIAPATALLSLGCLALFVWVASCGSGATASRQMLQLGRGTRVAPTEGAPTGCPGRPECARFRLKHRMIHIACASMYVALRISAAQRVLPSRPYSSSGGRSAVKRTGSHLQRAAISRRCPWDERSTPSTRRAATLGAIHHSPCCASVALRRGLPLLASSASRHPGN